MRYKINAGEHYCLHGFGFHYGRTERNYRIKISSECLYPIADVPDLGINKLCGWSYGLHHKDSIRIGWAPHAMDSKMIQLYTYIYNQGVRSIEPLCVISPEKEYEIFIQVQELFSCVYFTVIERGACSAITEGTRVMVTVKSGTSYLRLASAKRRFFMPKFRFGYNLYFYAGGTKPARRNWYAWVKNIG